MKKEFKHIKKDLKKIWEEIRSWLEKVWYDVKQVLDDFFFHEKHDSKFDKWLSKFNTWLVFLVMAVVLVSFVFWTGNTLKNIAEDFIEDRFITNITSVQEDIYEEAKQQGSGAPDIEDVNGKVISSSFTDLFSGFGWINREETTMFHETITTAFTFPPNFDWSQANVLNLDDDNFIERADNGNDKRCLGSFCLVQNGLNLYMAPRTTEEFRQNQYKVELPDAIQGKNLINISIGKLDTSWLFGAVEQKEGEYIGRVYYFDGESFNPVFTDNTPIESRYQGTLGFGGSDDNFLVIYGSYQGQAYHVGEEDVQNISSLFDIRVMKDGFHPVVIQQGEGVDSTWYIFSLTEGTPKMVKLFQNGTEDIAGIVDLTKLLLPGDTDLASFYLSDDTGNLYAKIEKTSGEVEYWEFADKGFDKSRALEVQSVNINSYPAEVMSTTLENLQFSSEGADVKFYASNNGDKWYEIAPGGSVNFNDGGNKLLWRASFEPNQVSSTSPFFDLIRLDYKVRF